PKLLERLLEIAAEPQRLVPFVGHGERMIETADRLDAPAVFEVVFALPAENENDSAVRSAGAPEEIVLVPADRRRQPIGRAEEIDRDRVAVVLREEGGARPVLRRQRLI